MNNQSTKSRTYRKAGSDKIEVNFQELLDQMLDPTIPAHLGTTYSSFKAGADGTGYSFMNQCWLLLQGAKGPVAPFSTWKSKKRFPRKGTAKTVLHPRFAWVPEKDKVTGLETGKKVKIFTGRFDPKNTAFDYADTFGEDIDWSAMPENWDLNQAMDNLEVKKVDYEVLDGNIQGYSCEVDGQKQFAINPVAAHPWKTTFHELGHIVLRHTDPGKGGVADYTAHRGVREFQAEAVAYLVAHELELTDWDPSESRAYVRHWLSQRPEEITDKHIQGIFGAANKILEAGRAAVENKEGKEAA